MRAYICGTANRAAKKDVGMAKVKKLSLGVQSFSKLIEKGYIYVDKTAYIYDLISKNDYYFLSRPRRFGKSLLLSTLAELFSGNRELFKDTFIDTSDYHWKKRALIELDFSTVHLRQQKISSMTF